MTLQILVCKNLYLFPQLFGEDLPRIDGWEGSNWENLEYITEAPKWMLNLWSEEELEWAKGIYYSEQAIKIRDRYITINQFLELERPGEKRSELVMEASKLVRGDYSSMPL